MAYAFFISSFQNLVHKNGKKTTGIDPFVFGKREGLVAKLFGCGHNNISRPFAQNKTAYRSCLDCGARKQFNPETLETHKTFYFPLVIKAETVNNI